MSLITIDSETEKYPASGKPETGFGGAVAPGADNGNRTRLVGLGSRSSTDKLCPHSTYIIHQISRIVNSFLFKIG